MTQHSASWPSGAAALNAFSSGEGNRKHWPISDEARQQLTAASTKLRFDFGLQGLKVSIQVRHLNPLAPLQLVQPHLNSGPQALELCGLGFGLGLEQA